jgi:hypothetical protein
MAISLHEEMDPAAEVYYLSFNGTMNPATEVYGLSI